MDYIVTAFCSFAVIAALAGIRYIFAKHGYVKKLVDKSKYYTLRRSFDGFKLCGGFTTATTEVTDRYYLRKDPFDVEIMAENILSADGRPHNAVATVKVFLPEENVIAAAEAYFGRYYKHNCDEEIDRELALYMSEGLAKLVEKYSGNETNEELERMLVAEIYMPALAAHHTVVSVENITII